MPKIGRPQKPFQSSWGEVIPGLYRCPDGRWRIQSTGQKFTEPDERRAVQKFKTTTEQPAVLITAESTTDLTTIQPVATINGTELPISIVDSIASDGGACPDDRDATADETTHAAFIDSLTIARGYEIPAKVLWTWLRTELIERPERIAKETAIPEIVSLRNMPMPRASVSISTIINAYRERNASASKERTLGIFTDFIRITRAKTLNEISIDSLNTYRSHVEHLQLNGSTKRWQYAQIKTVIAFGLKCGIDAEQIRNALDRCKVLWTADATNQIDPQPITKDAFHALLKADKRHLWRPWLLLSLNCCLHLGEATLIQWSELDLQAKTYATIRNKTKDHSIPRAAVLWEETIDALKTIKRTQSPYVFISPSGKNYNVNSRCNLFAELRTKAGLPATLTFDSIRDGSYTAACRASGVEERFARLLAGHASPGLQDHYVLRSPEIVKPACDAVYDHYGPFP